MESAPRPTPVGASPGNPALIHRLRAEIEAHGPIPFAQFMEVALYDPSDGYYLRETPNPGRQGDFLTAPEASAYFGLTLARQLAECWARLGHPSAWEIREYGAGIGGLAYDILAGLSTEAPDAAAGVRYRLAELSEARREEARRAMAAAGLADRIVLEDPASPLPPITGVALANEVADAMPVHRLVRRGGDYREMRVTWRDDAFGWLEGPLSEDGQTAAASLEAEKVSAPEGAILDTSPAAARWFARLSQEIARGYALIIDYGYEVSELYRNHRLRGTIRGYVAHTVTDDPFQRVGEQDLTAHVDFTALQRAGEKSGLRLAGLTTQGAFLTSLDLGDFLLDLQQDPTATVEDYLSAQAVVLRLIDPGGLGRNSVLVMARDAPVEPPIRGLAVPPPPF